MSTSGVWMFFKKNDNKLVSCNLCGKNYKSSGNTTNLATHLKNKHHFAYLKHMKAKTVKTITGCRDVNSETSTAASSSLELSYSQSSKTLGPSTSSLIHNPEPVEGTEIQGQTNNSGIDEDRQSQMSTSSFDEVSFQSPPATPGQLTLTDLIEKSSSFQEGGQKHVALTQALVFMVCKDNLPFSSVEKAGMRKFCHVACPRFKLPSRKKVTHLVEQKYVTLKAIIQKVMEGATRISLTSDILTLTNSSRSFIVMTAHFIADGALESVSFSARRMFQAHTADYINEQFEEIIAEFSIEKKKILSITTDGGANMVAASRLFLGEGKRIPCMAHLINLVVDGALKENKTFSKLSNHIKSIVLYFKQSVNATDKLRQEQEEGGKKEGEVLTLIQSVSTRWNSCLDMLDRFLQLSGIVAKILAGMSTTKKNVPDMLAMSQLNVVRELVDLLRPFKQATEEISGENYVTSSLVIPLSNLLSQEIELAKPSSNVGLALKQALLDGVTGRLVTLQKNPFLAKATIMDPRFKKIHFSSPTTVSAAILEISEDLRLEYKRRGKLSPEKQSESEVPTPTPSTSTSSIWSRHEKIVQIASTSHEIPRVGRGTVPVELKQYLDQPNIIRSSNSLNFWMNCRNFNPVLSEIALDYLIPPASSVSSERVVSAVNLCVPNNRSRLTGEHVKERVFLATVSNKYWNL